MVLWLRLILTNTRTLKKSKKVQKKKLGASTMLHNHVSGRCDLVACGMHRRLLYFCRACLFGWHPPSRPVVSAFAGPPLRGCARSPPTTLHNVNAKRSTVCVRLCCPVLCPSALLLCAPQSAIATKRNSKFVGVIRELESVRGNFEV